MGTINALFHHVRRAVKPCDIRLHIITGSTANIVRLLYKIQEDIRWVESIGDSIYFRAFFLNIRQPADNMVVFEVKGYDRKMADAFDEYLIAKVGELNLSHSQPVPQVNEVGK